MTYSFLEHITGLIGLGVMIFIYGFSLFRLIYQEEKEND